MKGILLASVKRMLKSLGVVTLMAVITLAANGRVDLIGALFIGYFAAAVYAWTMAYRIWRSAGLSASGAKREMLWGLVLRLAVLLVVLFAAVRISTEVFGMVVAGFWLFYLLFMVHLITDEFRGVSRDKGGSEDQIQESEATPKGGRCL